MLGPFNLAYRYPYGHGVPQDYVLAHVYCNLAASNGSGERDQRAEARDDIAKKLTREQLAEAQRMAREWRPNK